MGNGNTHRFGINAAIDLDALEKITRGRLEARASEFGGLSFSHRISYAAPVDRMYRAKASVEAAYHDTHGRIELAPMTIVVFAEGDGTGNTDTFPSNGYLPHHTPRQKPVPGLELMIPIGSIYADKWLDGQVRLREITTTDEPSRHQYSAAASVSDGDYRAGISAAASGVNEWKGRRGHGYLTQDSRFGFGDAHAIAFPSADKLEREKSDGIWLQIAGFLLLPTDNAELRSDVHELTKLHAHHDMIR